MLSIRTVVTQTTTLKVTKEYTSEIPGLCKVTEGENSVHLEFSTERGKEMARAFIEIYREGTANVHANYPGARLTAGALKRNQDVMLEVQPVENSAKAFSYTFKTGAFSSSEAALRRIAEVIMKGYNSSKITSFNPKG